LSRPERYDLVVVGGGISGLSAAHFYRAERPDAKLLILDNHDDFGGHAKRNEFQLGGKLHLLNGGTLEIDSPRPYRPVADGLLKTLGVDPVALTNACNRDEFYPSLGLTGQSSSIRRPSARTDWWVTCPGGGGERPARVRGVLFSHVPPLLPGARGDIERIETGRIDYMPGLTSDEKKDRRSRISYRDYLLTIAKVDPAVIPFYQTATQGEWGVGINAVSALDCWVSGCPDFKG
jgi:spermidine dehydrogenase